MVFNINYYDALQSSSVKWYEGENDDTAFTKYMLGVILSAYRDFEERLEIISEKKSAFDMVKEAIKVKLGKITKSDIMELCPSLSWSAVEKALRDFFSPKFPQKNILRKIFSFLLTKPHFSVIIISNVRFTEFLCIL